MNCVEERILKDGVVKYGNVLKVDSFLNHQIDVKLLDEIAREFLRRFEGSTITKVLTIESSGIAIACAVARILGVPVVFAKKSKSINLDGDSYVAEVVSDIIQVVYFKKTGGTRFFRMAPLHHHLELGGWSEVKLFCVFSMLTAVLCVLAFVGVMNRYPM